jgi:hypothetical protein
VSAVALKHCQKYPMHVYEVRPRKDHRGVDLISDALPFGGLWYTKSVRQRVLSTACGEGPQAQNPFTRHIAIYCKIAKNWSGSAEL